MKFDKNVPVPTPRGGGHGRWNFSAMKIGDSFAVPHEDKSVIEAAKKWRARHPGWGYATRTSMEGIRVWRVS
jgi:hypothetical protein